MPLKIVHFIDKTVDSEKVNDAPQMIRMFQFTLDVLSNSHWIEQQSKR